VLESAAGLGLWTLFGRAEAVETNALSPARPPRPALRRRQGLRGRNPRLPRRPNVRLGLGAQYALNFVPGPLEAAYRGNPDGAMAFIRLRID
jgi:hypothetical protein